MADIFRKLALWSLISTLVPTALTLNLSVASSGGNTSSPILYGIFYEDIYHSGDGGLYGELIRNRAFQGSGSNGVASTVRNTNYWHPVGGVTLSIDVSSPALSPSLPYQMRMDIPVGMTGTVGFYNDGFWGFHVDSAKRYVASMYMRGDYSGSIDCYFENYISGAKLSTAVMSVSQTTAEGWKKSSTPVFTPSDSTLDGNNTFYYMFDGAQLAGKSVYFNLLSVFKQTYKDRGNGLREDLATSLDNMNSKYLRIGGNELEGNGPPYEWKWNLTLGDLKDRPGRPGTWGDVTTDGLGLLEMMQWAADMGQEVLMSVFAGLYLNTTVISEAALQPYVDSAMNQLEFLLGTSNTTFGARRAALGYPDPFVINYVEIGNEDNINGGTPTYYAYRFDAFYNAIHAKYPSLQLISTVNPSPSTTAGSAVDIHPYQNEATFVSMFNAYDQASRQYPIWIAEYAAIRPGTTTSGQVGAQTLGMACAEAIFLLGCERNSDIVVGTSYGALIKHYDEEPGTVAVIKHTSNEILLTMSYYVQKLFADYKGTDTVPVTATGGGFGPMYWSATKSSTTTFLKMVNYNGSASTISVTIQGPLKHTATLITLTAPNSTSVNNLQSHGGETSKVITTTIAGSNGVFQVPFTSGYEVTILAV
ncbi:hypothetical protein BP5796_12437 [Coleophoma crateriformis]|uniref:non-reducing end alpha-L-arabinofuranosidase n=1 Tax=Coleophoma crateriformis TaxID=565419 RepID=A0A3D8QA15_9HELO|nr:hypothetical protein BP5796_12437 [Coleophoma crateriformis]